MDPSEVGILYLKQGTLSSSIKASSYDVDAW